MSKGWYQDRNGYYYSQIMTAGKRIFLGIFDTPEQAKAAYLSAKEIIKHKSKNNNDE